MPNKAIVLVEHKKEVFVLKKRFLRHLTRAALRIACAREHLLREGHASAVAAPMVRDTRRVVSISPAVLASREPHAASQRVRLPRSLLRNEPQYPTKGVCSTQFGVLVDDRTRPRGHTTAIRPRSVKSYL